MLNWDAVGGGLGSGEGAHGFTVAHGCLCSGLGSVGESAPRMARPTHGWNAFCSTVSSGGGFR